MNRCECAVTACLATLHLVLVEWILFLCIWVCHAIGQSSGCLCLVIWLDSLVFRLLFSSILTIKGLRSIEQIQRSVFIWLLLLELFGMATIVLV